MTGARETAGEVEVVEFTDPGCPWSWAAEPRLRWLHHRYDGHVRWRRVLGIQMDGPSGADSEELPEAVHGRWLQIAKQTDAPLAARLERAHASTRPVALAVKASERQGAEVADATLRRLREAFFVVGRPADRPELIAQAVEGVDGLDIEQLFEDAADPDVLAALQADFVEAGEPDPSVVGLAGPGPHPGAAKVEPGRCRYAFPTIIVNGPEGRRIVPGWRETAEYQAAIEAVAPALRTVAAPRLTAEEALDRYRSLSAQELLLLTGEIEPPNSAVVIATSTVPLWVDHGHPLASAAETRVAADAHK